MNIYMWVYVCIFQHVYVYISQGKALQKATLFLHDMKYQLLVRLQVEG